MEFFKNLLNKFKLLFTPVPYEPVPHTFVHFEDAPTPEPKLPVEEYSKKDEPKIEIKQDAPTPMDKLVEKVKKQSAKTSVESKSKVKNVEKDSPTKEQLQATQDLLFPKKVAAKSVVKSKKVKITVKKNKGKKK